MRKLKKVIIAFLVFSLTLAFYD